MDKIHLRSLKGDREWQVPGWPGLRERARGPPTPIGFFPSKFFLPSSTLFLGDPWLFAGRIKHSSLDAILQPSLSVSQRRADVASRQAGSWQAFWHVEPRQLPTIPFSVFQSEQLGASYQGFRFPTQLPLNCPNWNLSGMWVGRTQEHLSGQVSWPPFAYNNSCPYQGTTVFQTLFLSFRTALRSRHHCSHFTDEVTEVPTA